jgi:hypothetical protein
MISIFRVKELAKDEPSNRQTAGSLLLVSCLVSSSTLKMEAMPFSEISQDF